MSSDNEKMLRRRRNALGASSKSLLHERARTEACDARGLGNGNIKEALATAAQYLVDERHIWISKCISQVFSMVQGDLSKALEQVMSSGIQLERVNLFLAPHGPRGLFCLLGKGKDTKLSDPPCRVIRRAEKVYLFVCCISV